MLWSRWLKSEADLLTFQKEFERLAGNSLDMAYMQRSRVRGYFTTAGEMLAGFILGAVKLCHLWRGYKAPARAFAPRKRVSSAWCILRLNVLFDFFDWRAAT